MLGIQSLISGQKHTSIHLLVYAITMLTKSLRRSHVNIARINKSYYHEPSALTSKGVHQA